MPTYLWRPEALADMQRLARKWDSFASCTFYGLLIYAADGIISLTLWAASSFTSKLWMPLCPIAAALPILAYIWHKSRKRARLWHLAHFHAQQFNADPKHRLWAAEQAHAALCGLVPRSKRKQLETV